jgi:uncharacterized protein
MRIVLLLLVSSVVSSFTMAQTQDNWSSSRFSAFRLTPHQDLKMELVRFASNQKIQAGFIATCVGSLEQVTLRFANQEESVTLRGHFEILSLVGTFSESSSHLHLSVADSTGKTWGGHLQDGSLIYTTAEIVVGELIDTTFDRESDSTYGYKELAVKRRLKRK